MENIDDIFKKLSGAASVAKIIGVKRTAAQQMQARKSIPVRYWPALMRYAKERRIVGLTAQNLINMHSEEL